MLCRTELNLPRAVIFSWSRALSLLPSSILATMLAVSSWAQETPPTETSQEGAATDSDHEQTTATSALGAQAKTTLVDQAKRLPWLSDLEAARREARANRRPILVRFGGSFCPWCKRMDQIVATKEVQEKLELWTRVSIDVEKSPTEASRLGVMAIPALRVLSPTGKVTASHDGFLDAEHLIDWLDQQFNEANDPAADLLLGSEKPSLLDAVRLAQSLGHRNATNRQAAIRRLTPYPDLAGELVVTAFREGNLATRLAALELLKSWRAPIGQLDPWRPETITQERLDALEEWAHKVEDLADKSPPPSDEELLQAGEQIDRMLRAEPAAVVAIRERLAKLGKNLLPEVVQRLSHASTDDQRERLLALRYRLVSSPTLELRWPGGIERLASTRSEDRQQAAEQLGELATSEEQPLLLELFSDPDPLVREISLRDLRRVGGKAATSALVSLLDDPEPNVRAAVLKQLAEDAPADMIETIGQYVGREEDADLLVHAVRYFREVSGEDIPKHLLPLLDHESWQVRAETVETIGKWLSNQNSTVSLNAFSSSASGGTIKSIDASSLDVETAKEDAVDANPERESSADERSVDGGATGKAEDETPVQRVHRRMREMLDDSDAFVVSKTLEVVAGSDSAESVEPLVAAAMKHPELREKIIDSLAGGSNMRRAAKPHLLKFFKQGEPEVRAAAIRGLCKTMAEGGLESSGAAAEIQPLLVSALSDSESVVRVAGATSFVEMLDQLRPSEETLTGQAGLEAMVADGFGQPVLEPPKSFTGRLLESLFSGANSGPKAEEESAPNEQQVDEEKTNVRTQDESTSAEKRPREQVASKEETEQEFSPRRPDSTIPTETQRSLPPAPEPQVIKKSEEHSGTAKDQQQDDPDAEVSPLDEWLAEFHAGKSHPAWREDLVPLLDKMLRADERKECSAAALALIALGQFDPSFEVLLKSSRKDEKSFAHGVAALKWLPFDRRSELFRQLSRMAATDGLRQTLVHTLSEIPDPRTADLYWELLEQSPELASQLVYPMRRAYFGSRYYDLSSLSERKKSELADQIEPKAREGIAEQRLIALTLLAAVAPARAAKSAKAISQEPHTPESENLRQDAFQIYFALQTPAGRKRLAVDALDDADPHRQSLAVAFLAMGDSPLRYLRNLETYLDMTDYGSTVYSSGENKPIIPEAPNGLSADDVRPLADSKDPQTAACAGYLLTVMGEPTFITPLVKHWRTAPQSDELDRLMFRAVAVVDDSSYLPILKDIYSRRSSYEIPEFYWTIRIMSGAEILTFRKQIRKEHPSDIY